MPIVKLHNIFSRSPIGSIEHHFGYTCEIREDGVYADISDDLLPIEKEAGRVKPDPVSNQEKVEEDIELKKIEIVIEQDKKEDIADPEKTVESLEEQLKPTSRKAGPGRPPKVSAE